VAAAISYFILHPRKAIVASGTPHKAINTFGRPKSKILHQRICSTQLAGLFLPVKFIMIVPMSICQIPSAEPIVSKKGNYDAGAAQNSLQFCHSGTVFGFCGPSTGPGQKLRTNAKENVGLYMQASERAKLPNCPKHSATQAVYGHR